MYYLTEVYDTGADLAHHGSYNKTVFYLLFTFSLIFIWFVQGVIRIYNAGKKYYLLFGLLIIGVASVILKVKLADSCKNWSKGYNNERIDNDKYATCKISTPSHCWTEILDGVLDVSWLLKEQCDSSFRDGEIDELFKFVPKELQNCTTLAYPLTSKFTFLPESYFIKFFFNVMHRMIPIDDSNRNTTDAEVFLTYNNETRLGDISIKINKNETLIKERNSIGNSKNESLIKNVLIIYIDSISRSHFLRKMKKTNKFINRHINEEGNFTAYQFLKYHAFIFFTQPNVYPMFYGNSLYNKTGEDIIRHFHENGYISGQANNICERPLFDIEDGYLDNLKFVSFDHENIALFCDPNYFNPENPYTPYFGPYSIKKKCLYGRDTFEYVLEYGEKFWEAYKDEKKFLRIAFQDAHEGTGEVVRYLDDQLGEYLENFENKGYLNNTAVIIVSDHGNNMIGVYNIFEVEDFVKEKTLPYLSIILPKNMKFHNENVKENLEFNKNVMITPYDIYNTLLDFIDVDRNNIYTPHGKSLFEKIEEKERYCEKYNFDMKKLWCRCDEK